MIPAEKDQAINEIPQNRNGDASDCSAFFCFGKRIRHTFL